MSKQTAHQHVKYVNVEPPDSFGAAAIAYTSGVDGKGFREALWAFCLGDFVSSGTVVFHLEESSDDASADNYAAITGAVAPATGTYAEGTDDNKEYVGSLDLIPRERYIRSGYDVDTAAVEFSISCVLLDYVEPPVSQVQSNVFSIRV